MLFFIFALVVLLLPVLNGSYKLNGLGLVCMPIPAHELTDPKCAKVFYACNFFLPAAFSLPISAWMNV